jgi:DNA-binding MarR family transcriptional regulator
MKPTFTPSEKKVLHGLVKYPTLNDRELSEVIKVKPSTTTAIRRRLRKKDVFFTKRIPVAQKLGYELFIAFYGRISPKVKKADEDNLVEFIQRTPEIFLSQKSSDSVYALSYFRSFTEYRYLADAVWEGMGDSGLIDPDKWGWAIFSLGTSKAVNFFDYGPSLRYRFGIKEKEKIDVSLERLSKEKLSMKERIVLRGLINHPESSDKAVAEKIQASRQAVSSMRKRFEEKGILRTVRIVNLEKVGYKMLVLSHTQFGPSAPLKVRQPGLMRISELIPQLLNVASSPENILLASAESYDHFHRVRNEVVKYYTEKGYLRVEPVILLLPLSDLETLKNFDFSGMMDRIVQEGV